SERQTVDQRREASGLENKVNVCSERSAALRRLHNDLDHSRGLRRRASRGLGKALVRSRCRLELDPHDRLIAPNGIDGKELTKEVHDRLQPAFPAQTAIVELTQQGRCASGHAITNAVSNDVERETEQLLACRRPRDTALSPVILLAIGTRSLLEFDPSAIDLVWLTALSLISLGFGALRAASTVIERRGGQFIQRYRWTTFALMIASLVVCAGLGLLAQRFGMHEEARPLTFTIGIGLAGEGAITLIRAARKGAPVPWSSKGATPPEPDGRS